MLEKTGVHEAINTYARLWNLNPLYEPGTVNFQKTVQTRLITANGCSYGIVKIPFFGRTDFETYKIEPLPMRSSGVSDEKFSLKMEKNTC